MSSYLIVKSLHLLFAMGWVAALFYFPRFLINLAEVGDAPEVRARLHLMARRLARFGHVMFGLAVLLGLVLWLHFKISGGWLHIKLTLLAVLFGYQIHASRLLRRAMAGQLHWSPTALRIYNELPVLLVLAVILLALGKSALV